MATPLSLISVADLERLNSFALSDSPASLENLGRLIRELSKANNSERLAGVPPGCLVVAGQGIPHIRHYAEVEAILEFPEELQHPVEQASACFSLLRRHESNAKHGLPQEPMRIALEEVQRRLSHLLIQYPVLMDHRIVFGIRGPEGPNAHFEDDWATLACALAESSFASLPRLSDGLSQRQLRLFAANPCVRSGLSSHSPNSNANRSSVRSKTPIEVATGQGSEPSITRATRGAFLTSFLVLNEYSKQQCGRALLQPRQRNAEGGNLYRVLSKVFWDVATNMGMLSNVTRSEFVSMMKLQSPFARTGREAGTCVESDKTVATAIGTGGDSTSMLRLYMALQSDLRLFGVHHPMTAGSLLSFHYSSDEMMERTQSVAQLLVDVGAMEHRKEAMQWLASVSVGTGRMDATLPAPGCRHECVIGFLEALHQEGVQVDLTGGSMVHTAPIGSPVAADLAIQVRETWETALQVFQATKSMESVYATNASEAVVSSSSAVHRSRAQRRRV
jgi:hypothetical protein